MITESKSRYVNNSASMFTSPRPNIYVIIHMLIMPRYCDNLEAGRERRRREREIFLILVLMIVTHERI